MLTSNIRYGVSASIRRFHEAPRANVSFRREPGSTPGTGMRSFLFFLFILFISIATGLSFLLTWIVSQRRLLVKQYIFLWYLPFRETSLEHWQLEGIVFLKAAYAFEPPMRRSSSPSRIPNQCQSLFKNYWAQLSSQT
jgi:hypothetical protein